MSEAGFYLYTPDGVRIRFQYYLDQAPLTCEAFAKQLPFSRLFLHARYSGSEIWTGDMPPINVIQENASVWVCSGEVVVGPESAKRTSTINCLGIYYGEGKGVDACNIFAMVLEEDRDALAQLGELIWKSGELELTFERLRVPSNG
jgi:hypothetical protein